MNQTLQAVGSGGTDRHLGKGGDRRVDVFVSGARGLEKVLVEALGSLEAQDAQAHG